MLLCRKRMAFQWSPLLFLWCLSAGIGIAQNHPLTEEGTKHINGVDLYYKVIGAGEPIVILHGGPGMDHSYFLPQMEILAKYYKLIFFDQRAHGRSGIPADSTGMTMDAFVEDIEGIRKAFNIDKINLMGHSWGGVVAMWYGIKHPDHLRSLMLTNSAGASSEDRNKVNRAMQSRSTRQDSLERTTLLQSEDFKKRTPHAMQQLFRIAFRPSFYNRTLVDSLTLSFPPDYAAKSAALPYMWKDLSVFDIYPQLHTIKTATLILHGDSDSLPLEIAQKLHQHIPGSRLVVIKNCGHFPYIEAPEEFVRNIRDFIK